MAGELLARIAETGKHAWFESLADDAAESAGFRTVVVMPVLIRREVVALFRFFADEALAQDDRVLDAMERSAPSSGAPSSATVRSVRSRTASPS